ncbi:MAG TPA: orotidine-5'-phosphate decarboxylase [Methanoregulaceae archaeon]|nr:orotidine-5'-phosphate decarboxylase [Methanoregulaceae archaeon]HPD76591.1 orotidine-5'-phosphate decarboxylase [Methanoregulaceae archaeon]HRY74918.1 orotidine-5'-phosphate decarboxylase [Methanoregulaceae archaeon]
MADLILALDVTKREDAEKIAKACAPHIDAIKVGYPLALGAGLSIGRELSAFGLPLIADFKVADIPNTNTLITEQVFAAGFSAIICQGFPGTDSVRACVQEAHRNGGECYVVAEMSHPGAKEFFSSGVPEQIAANAMLARADGIIAPATRPDRVKTLRGIVGKKKILAPGIGAQGGDPGVAAIVDGLIVGRAIYEAEDPAGAARSFAFLRNR